MLVVEAAAKIVLILLVVALVVLAVAVMVGRYLMRPELLALQTQVAVVVPVLMMEMAHLVVKAS